jgi:hypothetical protein
MNYCITISELDHLFLSDITLGILVLSACLNATSTFAPRLSLVSGHHCGQDLTILEYESHNHGITVPATTATMAASEGADLFKKPASRLPRLVTKTLQQWFAAHASHPFPTEHEKKILQEHTNLSARQISNWFANARRRYTASSFDKRPTSSAHSISVPNLTSIARWQDLNPLDRWRHSPPDQEPAPFDAIAIAVRDSLHCTGSEAARLPDSFITPRPPPRAHSDNSFDSVSSLGASQSSNSTDSAFSLESDRSNPNLQHWWHLKPRRRRRRPSKQFESSTEHPANGRKARKYQCTFCTDTFVSKYDWTRHESALHLLLENWICCPQGPIYFDHVPRCSFCEAENPTTSHL